MKCRMTGGAGACNSCIDLANARMEKATAIVLTKAGVCSHGGPCYNCPGIIQACSRDSRECVRKAREP